MAHAVMYLLLRVLCSSWRLSSSPRLRYPTWPTPTALCVQKKEPFRSCRRRHSEHFQVCGRCYHSQASLAILDHVYTTIFTSHSLLLCCPLAPTMVSSSLSLMSKIRTLAPLTPSLPRAPYVHKLTAGASMFYFGALH